VLPIVQDICEALTTDAAERGALGEVAAENPGFFELTRQRAISYWNEYYRHDFPSRDDYPGLAALALVEPPTRPIL
jgi:hypothetical protein